MTDRTVERLGAACGIPAVLLSPIGFILISAAGFGGDPETPREEINRAVASGSGQLVLAGAMLDTLGSVFFVIFAARLWATLRRADGEAGWLSATCLAGALMAIAASFVDKSAFFAIGMKLGHGLATDEAVLLMDISAGSFLLTQVFLGVLFTGAAALVVLRRRAMPIWLGWAAVAVVLISLIGLALPEIGFVGFAAFALWVLATSTYLMVKAEPSSARQVSI